MQFLFVSAEGFAHFFRAQSRTLLVPPEISRIKWLGVSIVHFSVCVLNNLSLEYQISVPLHIVLRSGGGLVTLCIGTILGKSYSTKQWISVMSMTIGVVIATLGMIKDSEVS